MPSDVLRHSTSEQMRPEKEKTRRHSAWLFNSIVNKHADFMDSIPECTVLPREASDEPEAEKLTDVLPVVLERNNWQAVYSDGVYAKLKTGTAVYSVMWDSESDMGLGEISISGTMMKVDELANIYGLTQKSNLFDEVKTFLKKYSESEYEQLANFVNEQISLVDKGKYPKYMQKEDYSQLEMLLKAANFMFGNQEDIYIRTASQDIFHDSKKLEVEIKAIEKAIDDSVEVTIILSEKGDIPVVPDGVWRVGYKLMKRGAKVYMYTGGFNHSKAMCIDGKFCTIGSANFNSRSLRYDYETNIFIFSEEETAELGRLLKDDISKSYLLTEEIYKKRCLWHRFCGWLASTLTPLM